MRNLFQLKGTVKVFKIQAHLPQSKLKNDKRDIFYCSRGEITIVVTELMKIQRVEKVNAIFISSKGSKHDLINPTIRSKMIFGIASIMKRLHKNQTCLKNFFGNVCLDDKLEPRIKLPSISYYDISKVSLLCTACYELDYFHAVAPEIQYECDSNDKAKADVFGFALFIYSMFTNATDEKDFLKRYYIEEKFNKNKEYIPKKRDNIPDHYWDLLKKCWNITPEKRPSFDEIVDTLKNDKFALNEYSMNTNLDELHEYQQRIEND